MEETDQTFARPTPASANSHRALLHSREVGTLTWRGPALILFARPVLAIGAQALVAAVFALRGSSAPWHAAEPWLPVYGTLIDIGCLTLLWRLTRREGIGLLDLVGLDRTRIIRDASLGLALIPMSLVFIFGGTSLAGWAVYGSPAPPYFLDGLPLPAGVYGVLVWPFVWGLSEQMTYNGYLLSRFQVLFRSTSAAIVVVGSSGLCNMPSCR